MEELSQKETEIRIENIFERSMLGQDGKTIYFWCPDCGRRWTTDSEAFHCDHTRQDT